MIAPVSEHGQDSASSSLQPSELGLLTHRSQLCQLAMSSLSAAVLEPSRSQGTRAQQPCPAVWVIVLGASSQPEGHRLWFWGVVPWGMPFTAQLLLSTPQPNQTRGTPSEAFELQPKLPWTQQ